MTATLLGLSGSPVPESNTDRAVKSILEQTGLDWEFIKLSDMHIEPCRACLACTDTNECIIDDDARRVARKFVVAKGVVIGAYTPYSSLDARTKSLMERMYCLRHLKALNQGKAGVSVITTACKPDAPGLPPAAETAAAQIGVWMMEEGMNNLGSMVVVGNVPCIRCGHGDQCAVSGIKMMGGPDATVDSMGVRTFDQDGDLQATAKKLAGKLREAVVVAASNP